MRLDLLRAQHRGRGKIFVHCGEEFDAVALQPLLDPPQFQIDAAERRAAIA
ncbi:hypothetical protein ACVWWK_002726 [Bradyrhizobium sp. LB9.1b]